MSKNKRDKKGTVDPTVNLINQFRQIANSLQAYLYSMNPKDVAVVETLLSDYQKVSAAVDKKDLSSAQASDVKAIRKIITREQRQELNTKVKAQKQQNQKADARLQQQKEAREQEVAKANSEIKKLMPQVEKAHEAFMAIGLDSSFDKDDVHARYKELRGQLDAQARLLPDEARKEVQQQLAQMSSEINKHNTAVESQIADAKKVVAKAVDQAQKETKSLTVEQTILAILPGATQETIARLTGSANLLQIEGQGAEVGALVLRSLPVERQTALVSVLMQELAQTDEQGKSTALAEILKKGVIELVEGKKSHLSVVYELDGQINSIHIGLEALLNNPTRYITELTMAMLRQGVGQNDRVVMTLTSPVEVAALTHLDGADYAQLSQGQSLQLLTGNILEQSENPSALSRLVQNSVVGSQLVQAANDISKTTPPVRFSINQVFDLMQVFVTIDRARTILISPPQRQNDAVLGINAGTQPRALRGLDPVQPRQITGSAPTVVEEIPSVAPIKPVAKKVIVPLPSKTERQLKDEETEKRAKDELASQIKLAQRGLSRYVNDFRIWQSGLNNRLAGLDNLYYPDQNMVDAKDEFKLQIAQIQNEFMATIDTLMHKDYGHDHQHFKKDGSVAWDEYRAKLKKACEDVYTKSNGFDYDVGVGDSFKDIFKFIANMVIKAVNLFKKEGFGLFDYSSSKSVKAEFESIFEQNMALKISGPSSN